MYYIVYALLYLVSLIPLRILYIFSDFFYWIVYHVIRYRRDVVIANLTIAFPEKSLEEKTKIAREFYKMFIDSFVETIKLLSVNEEYVMRRFSIDASIVDRVQAGGKSCEIYLPHNFNWEWGLWMINRLTKNQLMVTYMPISNKIFDRLFYKMRTRFGCILLPVTTYTKAIMPYRHTQLIMSFVGDQNPGSAHNSYWLNFFGRPTPFLTGPEKNARLFKIPVLFMKFVRVKRGYYSGTLEIAVEDVMSLREGDLTIKFARFLENHIRENPANWLWTHRRFKFEWKDEYAKMKLEESLPEKNEKEKS